MFLRQWIGMGSLVGLAMNLETVAKLRPIVALIDWRATGSIGQVHYQSGQGVGG